MTVNECRNAPSKVSYTEFPAWAERQEQKHGPQVKCTACGKWRFKPERCEHFAELTLPSGFLEADDFPELVILSLGGMTPVQAEGTIAGLP